jgi:magnesium transporter
MPRELDHLNEPVLGCARKDFPELREEFTVEQALLAIRRQGVGEKVVYFYVVDEQHRLIGVLPTRRLLISEPGIKLSEIMIKRVVAIPATATILEACEMFVMHRFLAFPVVDENRRMMGVVDVSLFTEEVLDLEGAEKPDGVFEALGFRIAQVRAAGPWRAFRLRFPWLLTTITSGTLCAVLASRFEATIAKALILTFFLTLVLALAESVSIQSMALAVQALQTVKPSLDWFKRALWQEARTAGLLGLASGLLVALIGCVLRGFHLAPFVIGASVCLSLCGACLYGLMVPALLHRLKLDPKIAAGPVTLALADITTLLSYFGLAAILL